MNQPVSLWTFDLTTSDQEWREIADLFVACFSVAHYFEGRSELETIVAWARRCPLETAGSSQPESTASVGFALAHNVANNVPWRKTLERLAKGESTAAAMAAPQNAFVIHEPAVRE